MNQQSFTWLTSVFVSALTAHAFAAPVDATAPAAPEPAAVAPPAAPAEPAAPVPVPVATTPPPAPAPSPVLLQPAPASPTPTLPAPVAAPAPAFDDTGVPDDGTLGSHQKHFWFSGGARTTLVRSNGFDVFAGDDVLGQASFSFGRVLYTDGPWSLGASVGWDYGSRSADVRRAPTSLEVHRFTLNPEARYHFMRRLYGFARVGAGGAVLISSLSDPVTATERTRHPLRFTLDASVGAAYEVLGNPSGAARSARGWLILDAGYLFTASTDLVYESASGSPVRSAPIALGDLALSGLTARLSAAVTF